jgi:hypothetical protein
MHPTHFAVVSQTPTPVLHGLCGVMVAVVQWPVPSQAGV